MPVGSHFRPSLLAARKQLAEGQQSLRSQHANGSPGVQVCARLTVLLDEILLDLLDAILQDLKVDDPDGLRQEIALVPLGGYGRRALAPHSDLDLMLLHTTKAQMRVARLAQRMMQDIYDLGLDLGLSIRTPEEACQLATADVTICTSLIEARLLAGNAGLFERFKERFQKTTQRRATRLHGAFVEARREEQGQFGQTVYLLEPHIKRSRGGLRDIHLLRWLGFIRFGAADPDHLQLLGALNKNDQRQLREAGEFLLRVRNEMHFHAGKTQDVLDRAEQVRLAEVCGHRGRGPLLPVEQFMREYFQHTRQVRYLVTRFVDSSRSAARVSQVLSPFFGHLVDGDYRIGADEIAATRRGLEKLKCHLHEVLRLADLANLCDKRIAHTTWATVYRAAPGFPSEITVDEVDKFLSLLDRPGRLGELLRRLHELRVLEKIVPEFAYARCLLQFNEYHKYTVDEHCIGAVEAATGFLTEDSTLGQAYREIGKKRTVHLALLLHDLGKGHTEDHSEIGQRIAETTAERLRLPAWEKEVVKFLVHKHLLMSHLAFRRDTNDEELVVRFAVEVGSPDVLRMLFVLTCADLAAVGPGVLNDWKSEVLGQLYQRTLWYLAGDIVVGSVEQQKERRREVTACLGPAAEDPWFDRQLKVLPTSYLLHRAPKRVAATLRRLRSLSSGNVDAWADYLPESQTVEFMVGLDHVPGRGVFYKLAGALTSQGLAILSAEINTLFEGLVLDRFLVEDGDYPGRPPNERLEKVNRALIKSLSSSQPPKFRHVWGGDKRPWGYPLTTQSTQVRIDNNTSSTCTIVDVFAFDRKGLLYDIGRTLFELELSISVAKIGTYLDQVVDVFYITDEEGQKIKSGTRLREIRRRLLQAIEATGENL